MARDQDEPPVGTAARVGPEPAGARRLRPGHPRTARSPTRYATAASGPAYRGKHVRRPARPERLVPVWRRHSGHVLRPSEARAVRRLGQAFDCVLTRTTGSASAAHARDSTRASSTTQRIPTARPTTDRSSSRGATTGTARTTRTRNTGSHGTARLLARRTLAAARSSTTRQAPREPVPHAVRLVHQHRQPGAGSSSDSAASTSRGTATSREAASSSTIHAATEAASPTTRIPATTPHRTSPVVRATVSSGDTSSRMSLARRAGRVSSVSRELSFNPCMPVLVE